MRELLFSLLLLLTSCGKQTDVQPMHIVRLNLFDDPVSLDPHAVRSLKDLTVVKQLFEGLMRLDAAGIPQPAVAQQVTLSEDHLRYTFHLRSTFWNNLQPVTAFNFEAAWKKIVDPTYACDYAHMLYPIKNAQLAREGKCPPADVAVKALDEHTLVVELNAPTPYFLELVAFPTYFPSPSQQEEKFNLISNGPFSLQEWKPQHSLVLIKNPTYWDQEAVHLDLITFSIISDNHTESYLFEKAELDWLGQPISSALTAEFSQMMQAKGELETYPIAGTYWFKFNTKQSPFDVVKIRKAFALAIQRKALISHILQGHQTVATGPIPPSMALNPLPYFEDENEIVARHLFEEALEENGWTRATFPHIVFNFSPSERGTKIAQLVQQQWREVFDISVELQALENQLYIRHCREGLYQVGPGEWIADYNDPIAFLEIFRDPNNGINDTRWSSPLFNALLDASIYERDAHSRTELLQQAESILVDEMPIAPLYHYAFDYIKKPYVKDVILSPLGIADFKTARLEK